MSTNNPNQPAAGASAEAQETAPLAAAESNPETSAPEATHPNLDSENDPANGESGEMMTEDFGAILERHERQRHAEVSEGEVVKGTVDGSKLTRHQGFNKRDLMVEGGCCTDR